MPPNDDSRSAAVRSCECGVCDKTFSGGTIAGLAKSIAKHWNDEHGDELRHSMQPFKREEYGGRHLHGDEYAYHVHEYYVTAYDVIDADGDRPFKYQYVKKTKGREVCEDCWRSINNVDGYRELPADGWRDKYRCDDCHRERQIERRKNENENLGEFA